MDGKAEGRRVVSLYPIKPKWNDGRGREGKKLGVRVTDTQLQEE